MPCAFRLASLAIHKAKLRQSLGRVVPSGLSSYRGRKSSVALERVGMNKKRYALGG